MWAWVAQRASDWAAAERVALRDAVFLVPFVQLLPEARQAFADVGGWQPRIETTQTLADQLGPRRAAEASELSGDAAVDRWVAQGMLAAQSWVRRQLGADPVALEQAATQVVAMGTDILLALRSMAPPARSAWLARLRLMCLQSEGLDQWERALLQVALEWAAVSDASCYDALFELRPSAWLVLQAGGEDRLVAELIEAAGAPTWLALADPVAAAPFGQVTAHEGHERWLCDDLESEALAAMDAVVCALNQGQVPVAVVAQDRLVTRRVRALAERLNIPLADESGWRLPTTRAAATVMTWLRAVLQPHSRNLWMDALKCLPWVGEGQRALDALEAAWRRHGLLDVGLNPRSAMESDAEQLWQRAQAWMHPLTFAGERTLCQWLAALHQSLHANGSAAALAQDPAGQAVMKALRLSDRPPDDEMQPAPSGGPNMTLATFVRWVDVALEQALFVPAAPSRPAVVITPLVTSMLRDFGAVVVAGADDKHLAPAAQPPGLLSSSARQTLGMPNQAQRNAQQLMALTQVLRNPRVTFVRRRQDGDEPRGPSPWLSWWNLVLVKRGVRGVVEREWAPRFTVLAQHPLAPPSPAAAHDLPGTLSASAVEDLRECPYRFFARRVLGLGEIQELDLEAQKRDYGTWLHAVLHRFHQQRPRPRAVAEDVLALHEAAAGLHQDLELNAGDWLPWVASFTELVPPYAAWLAERDAEGWVWLNGETELRWAPEELQGVVLKGVIDRVDERAQTPATLHVIDYKTGGSGGLMSKVRQPLEDTQLAFYAALVGRGQDRPELKASYLALDERGAPIEVPHPLPQASATQLIDGLALDLAALRAGEGMRPLGEGAVCERCECRGLCRKDHWYPAPGAMP